MTPATTTLNLEKLTESLGLAITHHNNGPKGWYSHHTRTISLRSNLTEREYRSTLAHELGHAVRGDTHTGTIFDQRAERAADQFAAQLLIDHDSYARAEAIHGTALDAIGYELGVTTHLLAVWRDMYERQKQ